ncbi:NADH-quinone oxidoreductase subunit C [Salinisphaera hydrothermalis]|uniref:hydrogenase large subunit n=1 Tax=Salinisphaera hydrothermalis TaxID=563188 RepID=UPI003342A58A
MKDVECVMLSADALRARCEQLVEHDGRMQMIYAWRDAEAALEVRYLCAPAKGEAFEMWCCRPVNGRLPSVADIVPLASWYEREMRDLFALDFDDQPEPAPLVLHEGASSDHPPMEASHPRDRALAFERTVWAAPEISANGGVQRLPFGPVRADVMESAQFIFYYLGESILHYQPRLFFKHRGLEKRFEGVAPALGTVLAERVSGVGSLAHVWAYCRAIESMAEAAVPRRAEILRALLAELERIYNHLHYFAHLASTTTLYVGDAQGRLLEERAKQINARLTGSRFLRGVVAPGGLRRDLTVTRDLLDDVAALADDTEAYLKRLEATPSYMDRLIETGVLSYEIAYDQGATGPVERASGLNRDLRRDHPYSVYPELAPEIPTDEDGDALARARVRAAELRQSFELVPRLAGRLDDGPVRAELSLPAGGTGLGWVEGARGALYYAVHTDADGHLARVKVKSPSFSNWRVFPFTMHGGDIMDYAINEASFGLTIAGCDR